MKEVNASAIHLENILLAMANKTFCKTTAAEIVGGRTRLVRLVESGEIRANKTSKLQNGRWYCNAADVLRHCRNMRVKSKSNQSN
ncbi:MAG: hypothetical protein J6N71_06110 [Muribaculaceae bacterium]|nr:hypothetical protein [Muribaculaceae bacterium]